MFVACSHCAANILYSQAGISQMPVQQEISCQSCGAQFTAMLPFSVAPTDLSPRQAMDAEVKRLAEQGGISV